MSFLFLNDPFEYTRPSRLLDQNFGLGLHAEDLLTPTIPRDINSLFRCPAGYLRPWRSPASHKDAGSTVCCDKEKFQASLDVQQFKPEEICVKVSGNVVTVQGKHEEKEDEHGYVSREFVRKYVVPKGHDLDRVVSKLSSDGVLSIIAPRVDGGKEEQREVVVVQTGEPSKSAEKEEKDEK